jgi:hypothetical protein
MIRVFPPPASGADILSGFDSPGTRLTADAGIVPVMEFVIGYMMLPDVSPYFLFTPVDQWIYLNEVMDVIPFN